MIILENNLPMHINRDIFNIIAKMNEIRDENELIREFPHTYGKFFGIDNITFLKIYVKRHPDREVREPIVGLRNATKPKDPMMFTSSTKEINECFIHQKPVKKVSKNNTVVYLFPLVDEKKVYYILTLKFDKRDVTN